MLLGDQRNVLAQHREWHLGELDFTDAHRTDTRCVDTREETSDCRFAGAGGANNGQSFAGLDRE